MKNWLPAGEIPLKGFKIREIELKKAALLTLKNGVAFECESMEAELVR
jgi:hypothetical protein